MHASAGELLTHWTVRLAVACYAGRLACEAGWPPSATRARVARVFWTVGCVLFLVHVACAFGFYHGWSHQRALEHTAAETRDLTGLDWGGGLWFNYVFTVWWTADAVLWWFRPVEIRLPKLYLWTMHAYFAFMTINATAVFGPPFWKRAVTGFVVGAALLWMGRNRRSGSLSRSTNNHPRSTILDPPAAQAARRRRRPSGGRWG